MCIRDSYWPTVCACDDADQRDKHLRYFEVALLEQLGLAPILTQDTSANPIDAEKRYCYRVPEGPLPHELARGNGIEITGSTLLDMAAMKFTSALTLSEAKKLTRALIHYHLDGKELLSRALFKSFHEMGKQSNG